MILQNFLIVIKNYFSKVWIRLLEYVLRENTISSKYDV